MKKILSFFCLLLISVSAFAGGSSPGLYNGQIPTAAQWNSYFAAKLDWTPGTVNQMAYWDGSGNLINASVSGACTSVANVFTCSANTISGGSANSFVYQSGVGATSFLLGNTTTTPEFVSSLGNGTAALTPSLISSTGSGTVVLNNSPTLIAPALGTPTSVTLTNGSGLPLTTGVTGVLPIANGGTGSATQNFVDTSTAQTVAGIKTFSASPVVPNATTATQATAYGQMPLAATTTSLGGSALVAGACASVTTTVTGATTSMTVTATPQTYPGDGADWAAYISAANTVVTKICAFVALTPTASVYNLRVIQ